MVSQKTLRDIIILLKQQRIDLIEKDMDTSSIEEVINKIIEVRKVMTEDWCEYIMLEFVTKINYPIQKIMVKVAENDYVVSVENYNGNNFPKQIDKVLTPINID